MRRIFTVFQTLALLALSGSLFATQTFQSKVQQTQLIEMYSSQGCSSCPPAQRYINTFKDSNELWSKRIPLVFHVDYWDYLGWIDPYADAKFSQRQRAFARADLANAVYTPGFIVDGREWRGFFKRQSLPSSTQTPGVLKVDVQDQSFTVMFDGQVPANARVNVALLGFDITTQVSAGENARRTLDEEFIVLEFQSHQYKAAAKNTVRYQMPRADFKGRKGLAVWLTDARSLVPIQATGGMLE